MLFDLPYKYETKSIFGLDRLKKRCIVWRMNETTKIDINGSVGDAINEGISAMFVMSILLILGGFLFAPWFADFRRRSLEKKYNVSQYPSRWPMIHAEIAKTRLILWVVAIISWIVVIGMYAASRAI